MQKDPGASATSACCTPRRLRSAKQIDIHRDVEYAMGQKVLLSTKNLRLKLPRKLQDQYVGPFEVLKRVGPTAYKLDLSHSSALKMNIQFSMSAFSGILRIMG